MTTIRYWMNLFENAAADGDAFFVMTCPEVEECENPRSRTTLTHMSPADFLLMCKNEHDDDKAEGVARLLKQGTKFRSLPMLGFTHDGKGSAQVMSHEGRHRARALQKLGVRTMPVVLNSLGDGQGGRAIRWGSQGQGRFDHVEHPPQTLHGEDGRGTIPMPDSDIYPLR